MQFILYTALAAASLVKRQASASFTITNTCNAVSGSVVPGASANFLVVNAGPSTNTCSSTSNTTPPPSSSTAPPTSFTNNTVTFAAAPVVKRQVVVTTFQLAAGPCVAGPNGQIGSGINTGAFVPSGAPIDVSQFCTISSISATFPDGTTACSPLAPALTGPACGASITTTTTQVTSVTQITNININVNVFVTIGACPVCGPQTYYYQTQCPCLLAGFITTYGVVYNCPGVTTILVTRPYVVLQGVTTVITVPSIASTPVVPLITITTQGVVAVAPATTLANVVTQAVVTQAAVAPPPVVAPQQPVVTPFTGGANKAGLGALAAIAGAAAFL